MHDDAISILTSALQREQFPTGEWRWHNGKPSPGVLSLPFYGLVPKDPIEQIRWRLYVRERGAIDPEFAAGIKYACQQDILFACNSLVWIFEPRPVGRVLPFNTWSDQDDYISWIYECMGVRDVGVEKCRGIGFSYLVIAIFFLDWFFRPMSTLGLMSRKEDAVDDKENPDALMWKLDFMYKWLPEWLRLDEDGNEILDRSYSDHRFINTANQSTIYGYEATGNVMTGGRKRAILRDESAKFPESAAAEAAASTQHVSNCLIDVSTYYRGTSTLFYRTMRVDESSMLKIRAHWHKNPERAKGLYTFSDGQLIKLDPTYEYPEDYDFVDIKRRPECLGQATRSPWYDAECRRPRATKQSVAEELDIDPQTASSKLFHLATIEKARKTCRSPVIQGFIEFDYEKFEPTFIPADDGNIRVWLPINNEGKPGHWGPGAAGCDISAGTGRSNSSLEVIDTSSGEQVLEFTTNRLDAVSFAEHVYAILKWLCDDRGEHWVVLNFESNGVGNTFFKRVKELGWGNFYLRETMTNTGKKSKQAGWFSKDKGLAILSDLQRVIYRGLCTVRSAMVVDECDQYELAGNSVIHVGSKYSAEADEGEFHGDAAMGLALAWLAAKELITVERAERRREIPPGSLAERMLKSMKKTGDGDWWDGSEIDTADIPELLQWCQVFTDDRRHEPLESKSSGKFF